MQGATELWVVAGFISHLFAAAVLAIVVGWIVSKGDKQRPDRIGVIGALSITAVWCIIVAALGPSAYLSQIFEMFRNLSWLYATYRLFMIDGRHRSLAPIRPVIFALLFVELLQLGLLVFSMQFEAGSPVHYFAFQVTVMFSLLVAVGTLVLLHNLYAGAAFSSRPILRWLAAALAAIWVFELNLFTIAYLTGSAPIELYVARGFVTAAMAVPLAIGMRASASTLRLRPSRTIAFQTLSLLAIGAYLLLMVGLAQSFSMLGSDIARLTQVGFTAAASVLALLWLPSKKLRGWLRVTAIKHLFQHRYDYRVEWLRFTQTIGDSNGGEGSLQERAIKAVADITDSPGGLLFLYNDTRDLELASRWSWNEVEVPVNPFPQELTQLTAPQGFIVDIDDIRNGIDRRGEADLVPEWILQEARAWAIVPLLHFDRLAGLVVLSRPLIQRRLDWEDFDLLRVVGQQLASYLSEQAGQQALMEATRFDEFNRRIAFVMHDIKNLASQLALLARNAEKHVDNPEFRDDMLVTLRSSANKLKTLLDRLNRYGSGKLEALEPVSLGDIAKEVAAEYQDLHPVYAILSEDAVVLADRDSLVQAIIHMVQNGVDASDEESPVYLNVSSNGSRGQIEIVDSGCGMSAEFLRDGLFKPFISSKANGFGIGAFESRELIRGMGGRLDVDSREEVGTRFIISFPSNSSAGLVDSGGFQLANEVA